MKKILFFFIVLASSQRVCALGKDITNDIEIKYKWYKNNIEEIYYPIGEFLDGYEEDSNRIVYSNEIEWDKNNCNNTSMDITRVLRRYSILEDIRFILFDEFDYDNNITLLCKGKPCTYNISYNEDRKIIFNLVETVSANNLIIFVDSDEE